MRNSWFEVWALALAAAVAGCGTTPVQGDDANAPSFAAPAPLPGRGVALVLSGGAARGYAHAGVLKALEANGLRPDLIVGTSAGSIVGALYASGLTAAELEGALQRLDASTFLDLAPPGLPFLPSPLGLARSEGLQRFIATEARRQRMEEFPIRFAAVATDLHNGEPQVFNAGDVARAVSASSAMPGLLTPVRVRGRLYGDGQLSSPLAVTAARSLGARVVIAVDVIYPPKDSRLDSTLGMLFQGFLIAVHRLKEWEIASADSVIIPDLGSTSGQWSFDERERLIAAGEAATKAAMERLRGLFLGRESGLAK